VLAATVATVVTGATVATVVTGAMTGTAMAVMEDGAQVGAMTGVPWPEPDGGPRVELQDLGMFTAQHDAA